MKNVCLDNGLNWIEDSSNTLPIYQRNVVRPVLQRHPDIYSDVIDLIRLFQESREICNISGKNLKNELSVTASNTALYFIQFQKH